MSRTNVLSRPRSATIKDVARVSGVSVSTVSRVIRGRDEVSEETRRTVLGVIDQLGYRPSATARALVAGYSNTIALLVSDIANPFYPQLAKSIEREASAHGYALIICNTEDDPTESVALFRRLISQGVDGMIHASVGADEDEVLGIVGDLRHIVFTNRRPLSRDVSYVVADNRKAAALVTGHLIDQGHARIGFISGPSWAANATERLDGFLRTVDERGVDGIVFEGEFTSESGSAAVRAWAADEKPPTAVIGVNDTVALGAIGEMRERFGVGFATAVAGFDNIDSASSHLAGLTTVAAPIDEMGRRCVRLLLRQLAGKLQPPKREVLEPSLHIRRTTASRSHPWTDDPATAIAVGKWKEESAT